MTDCPLGSYYYAILKSYLAMDGGGEIRAASLPALVLRFVVLSVCDGVWG